MNKQKIKGKENQLLIKNYKLGEGRSKWRKNYKLGKGRNKWENNHVNYRKYEEVTRMHDLLSK